MRHCAAKVSLVLDRQRARQKTEIPGAACDAQAKDPSVPTVCGDCPCPCWVMRLPPEERERVVPLVRQRPVRKGEVLQHEGRTATSLRSLREGLVLRTRLGRDGQERPVALGRRGEGMGMLAYFSLPDQTSMRALGIGRVCEVSLEALQRLHADLPGLADALVHETVQVIGTVAAWSQALHLRQVGLQLVSVLLLLHEGQGQAEVELPTQAILAALLGASRETVARALLILEERAMVVRRDRRYVQLDVSLLRDHLSPALPDPEGEPAGPERACA